MTTKTFGFSFGPNCKPQFRQSFGFGRNYTVTFGASFGETENSSFGLTLIGLKSQDIILANIYRPPLSSKSIFLEEFASLLATLGTDAADRLMICSDFNIPDISPNKIDDDLAHLLNSTCFTQHVNASTRHDSHHTKSSLLDLIITPSTSKFVSTTSVVSSHEISDHDIALANLTTKRFKPPRDHINIAI